MIGMNPITTKNNTIVILHFNDKERGSERLTPNGDLHGDDTVGGHKMHIFTANIPIFHSRYRR
jgi:hypothetical protein